MSLASLVCSTIIGLPLGIWMFDLVPPLVSLQR
jgi:ABC-type proline/glycine betaine transport system permease subunit